jgi:GTP cyclohydrolase I
MELIKKANGNLPRNQKEVEKMIKNAAKHYGKFLEAMGFDYKADRQTIDTPMRVAKAWSKDLIIGSLTENPSMTIFPNDEGYSGVVIQTGIRVNSLCAHHNLPFNGWASVAYIPEEYVIGLSKLNRVVDWFARRPQMQESLTQQIHDFLSNKLQCKSVAVSISSKHLCCGNRGIKHPESVMTTNSFSGVFMEKDNLVREEFIHAISKNGNEF